MRMFLFGNWICRQSQRQPIHPLPPRLSPPPLPPPPPRTSPVKFQSIIRIQVLVRIVGLILPTLPSLPYSTVPYLATHGTTSIRSTHVLLLSLSGTVTHPRRLPALQPKRSTATHPPSKSRPVAAGLFQLAHPKQQLPQAAVLPPSASAFASASSRLQFQFHLQFQFQSLSLSASRVL